MRCGSIRTAGGATTSRCLTCAGEPRGARPCQGRLPDQRRRPRRDAGAGAAAASLRITDSGAGDPADARWSSGSSPGSTTRGGSRRSSAAWATARAGSARRRWGGGSSSGLHQPGGARPGAGGGAGGGVHQPASGTAHAILTASGRPRKRMANVWLPYGTAASGSRHFGDERAQRGDAEAGLGGCHDDLGEGRGVAARGPARRWRGCRRARRGPSLSALVSTTWKVTAERSRSCMISASAALIPWRASTSTNARRSVGRPAR